MSTSVLVADNYEPCRRFVRSTSRKRPELQVIGEVSDGLEAVLMVQEMHPALILLDISLPAINGFEVARRISQISPQSRIIFVSEYHSADMARDALSVGACGDLVKSDCASELLPAVQSVLEGKHYVSRTLKI
jgi:DNA-binding NarL/FixJ family response regulator